MWVILTAGAVILPTPAWQIQFLWALSLRLVKNQIFFPPSVVFCSGWFIFPLNKPVCNTGRQIISSLMLFMMCSQVLHSIADSDKPQMCKVSVSQVHLLFPLSLKGWDGYRIRDFSICVGHFSQNINRKRRGNLQSQSLVLDVPCFSAVFHLSTVPKLDLLS